MKLKKNLTIPKHIAFIMDGNGRWAKRRLLPRHAGHKAGIEAFKLVLKRCFDLGIETVSVFAFSTENWNRPKVEVDEIMRLTREFLQDEAEKFLKHEVRLVHSGNRDALPAALNEAIGEIIKKTAECKKHTLNLCFNYGGRSEIVAAVNKVIADGVKVVDEKSFATYLQNAQLSEPDIVVRTSGEERISNFMLWQMAYSELYFPKTYWPDMNEKMVDKVVKIYNKRERRFGTIKS